MNTHSLIELIVFMVAVLCLTKPLGLYLQFVLDRDYFPFEKTLFKFAKINPQEPQRWTEYARDLMGLSLVSFLLSYLILRFQNLLPLNPQHFAGLSPELAFNTAISFTTNTDWQAYSGESTLSYFSQMVALVIHNFFSASVGICAAVAVIRGLAAKDSDSLGNFWRDFVRVNLFILLPCCFLFALFLVSQGVIQNFSAYTEITTLEGAKQTFAWGPVASQVAIKMFGTNGGGFFNANAAHPFENPNALSNFVQMVSIFALPSGLVYLLGKKTGNLKHGWSVWAAMALIFVGTTLVAFQAETAGNSSLTPSGALRSPFTQSSELKPQIENLEGKETRFGIADSALFASVTTAASCGAVNSMHDSYTPLGGAVPLFNIMLGEIVFGGVGSGLYGMIMFIILTVFISGLMVGRTPEYLGKRIEGREVKYAMLALIVSVLSILGFSAWAAVAPQALASLGNAGPHGLSELIYATTSATGNNGSAFGGLNANIPYWNIVLGIAMFFGRFFMMIPILAIGGSLSTKKIHAQGEGTFPIHGALFVGLLIGVILIVGALTYFPVLSLAAIAEHFEMLRGHFL